MIKVHDLLKKYDFTIQKKYGQNFLVDQHILEGIVSAAEITAEDVVLEIGPGLGSLTQYLCASAKHVIAVEIDRMLIPILKETMAPYDNFTLVNQDILKTDIDALVKETLGGEQAAKIKIVANLPYYITTPIIMELLEKETHVESITVMVQKEVAERMQVGTGTKAYGALSLAVQYYSLPKIVLHVSKNSFVPKPDVDSAVIKLSVYDPAERPVKVEDPEQMFKVIRAAFNQRRKTLVNALSNAGNLSYSKDQILTALKEIQKAENIRGEALSLEEFAALTEALSRASS